jgi:PAS domain S-box-containing protein
MLEQVFDALREPVIVFSQSGQILRANQAVFDLVGLPPRAVEDADYLAEVKHLQVRTADGQPLRAEEFPSRLVLAGEANAQTRVILTRRDGQERNVEVTASRVAVPGDQSVVLMVLRDITAESSAQAMLERLVRTLRAHSHTDSAALRASDESDYLAEVCRIIVDDCRYPMAWVGLAQHDEARTVRPVAHAGFNEGYVDQLRISWSDDEYGRGPTGTAIRTGEPCECRDMRADARVAPWRKQALERGYASSVALPIRTGTETIGALTIYFTKAGGLAPDEMALLRDLVRDIGDGVRVLRLRSAEVQARRALARQAEELARADRLKDVFLATLSHELRTPLSTILVWAHLLLNAKLDADAHRRAEEAILRNAEAQRELINDILDVSRIVSGKLHLDTVDVRLRGVLEAALEVIRPAAEAKRIAVDVQVETDATVGGDAGRLQQALWNVLSNAVKFTPEGGRITVRLDRPNEDHVTVRVTDTGIGVAPEFLPRIFDRFTQQDSSASREHGGLGLGLAIVRHLVELHGGTVAAGSEGVGHGTTFTLTLPARRDPDRQRQGATPAGENQTDSSASGNALGGIRILAVDDDADSRELLVTVLGALGAEIVVVESAESVLDRLRVENFHVLLADIAMPGTDGYALIEAVRLLSGDAGRIPAIALSALGRQEDRARALAAGYQAHMSKPVLPDQLAAAIAWFSAARNAPGVPKA